MQRVLWFLSGPRRTASSRMHGYNIHDYLLKRGWSSSLVLTPLHSITDIPLTGKDIGHAAKCRHGDIVVIQKLAGAQTLACIESFKTRGARVVLVDCDYPLKVPEAKLADLTICSSARLADAYRSEGVSKVFVIPEAYETHAPPSPQIPKEGPIKLRCVWFGSMDPLKEVQLAELGTLLRRHFPCYQLITVSNHVAATYMWDSKTCWDLIKACDVALITGDSTLWTCAKSHNRIIQAMALGLPTIAYPTPAAREVIRHGRNGFLCEGEDEWVQALVQLGHPTERARVAHLGYRYARLNFAPAQVGALWENTILGGREAPTKPYLREEYNRGHSNRMLKKLGMWRLFRLSAFPISLRLAYLKRAVWEAEADL